MPKLSPQAFRLPPEPPCPAFADLLVDYSDGELTGAGRQNVHDHIASCSSCRVYLDRLDASRQALLSALHLTNAAATAPNPTRTATPSHQSVRSSPQWLAIASTAAAILVIMGALVWFTGAKPPLAGHQSLGHAEITSPTANTPAPALSPRKITTDEALWQVAVLEERARLQAALDLLPSHGPFAAQREADQRLLAKFQTLVSVPDIQ